MKNYVENYLKDQKSAVDSIPADEVAKLIEKFREALDEDRQIFVLETAAAQQTLLILSLTLAKAHRTRLTEDFGVFH